MEGEGLVLIPLPCPHCHSLHPTATAVPQLFVKVLATFGDKYVSVVHG